LTNGKVNGRINGQIEDELNGSDRYLTGDDTSKPFRPIFGETLLADDGLVDNIVGMGGDDLGYSDYIKSEEKTSLPADDGLINGLVEGVGRENFLKDTLVSGDLLSGGGGRLPHRGMPPSWFKKGLGTVVIMIFLLTIPIMLNILYVPVEVDIEIDGDFEDWHAVRAFYDPENFEVDDSVDIREYKIYRSGGYLYLYMQANGTLFETDEGVHSVRFFVDIEGFGYEIGGIQADYLLEVYGWDGNVEGTSLHRFNESRRSDDWNGFNRDSGGQAEAIGKELEARFWIGNIADDKEPSLVVHSMDNHGWDMTAGKVWEGMNSLTVKTELFGPKVLNSGELEPLFKFETFSISEESLLESIVLDYNEYSAEVISDIEIFDAKNYTDGTFVGEPIATFDGFERNASVSMDVDVDTTPREFIVAARIEDGPLSGEPVGLRLKEVICKDGLSTISPPIMENKYIDEIPSEPQIDGAFAFWDEYPYEEDPFDDLTPHDAWNPNIDIRRHSLYSNDKTFFNVGVEGNMMGGEDIPYSRSRPPELVDSDGDGIPDKYDPYPNDFTNDGTPDDEMLTPEGLPDVDGDGVADWPYGPDKWLNTTIPEDPKIPERYWGREVSRYIGPVEIPVVTGEDYLRIFIDSDPDEGYTAPWLDMRADHMINISGRNMEITSANYAEYDGDGGDWEWDVLGEVEAAINRTSLETALDLEELGIDDYDITYVMTDWENNMDTAGPVPNERYELTQALSLASHDMDIDFYLRDGDELLLERGSEEIVAELDSGETHTWESPEFSDNYNITSDIDVRLNLDPDSPGGQPEPELGITLLLNDEAIGEVQEEITSSGVRTFSIEPWVDEIHAGDTFSIETEVSGPGSVELDIFYNSPEGRSRISLPSDNIIEIESLGLLDEEGDEEDIFQGGDEVEVRSVVEHRFTSDVLEDAVLDVYFPDDTKMISEEPMDILDQDTSDPPNWKEFNHVFELDEDTLGGTYHVVVSATDIQGNLDTLSTSFTVQDTPGVSVYPDNVETSDPGTEAIHEVSIKNIGELDDIYKLSVSSSSRNWYTELKHDGETIAFDEDGDGDWDWIDDGWDTMDDGYLDLSLYPLEEEVFELMKVVPEGTDGQADFTDLIAESYNYEDISDFAQLVTQTPVPNIDRVLYMVEDYELDTSPGDNQDVVSIDTDDKISWTQELPMADDFDMVDYSNVFLYIDPNVHGYRRPDVTVTLEDDVDTIGTDTISDIEEPGWYQFVISTDHTVDSGSSIELSVTTGSTSIDLFYGSENYDSRVEFHTDTYLNVDQIRTYDEYGETDEVSAGEEVEVRGLITEPMGSRLIDGATISVVDPEGDEIISDEVMVLHDTDPESPSLWKEYSHSWTLSEEAPVGEYSIEIQGVDTKGVTSTGYSSFSVPGNVTVDPDQNDTAEAGTIVSYDFTVKNDGSGLNIFSLELGSSQGWNVTLYDSDGTWIGTDLGGDGNWDDINSDYDSTGDGIPDTGYLIPGAEMDVTMEIEIPEGVENGTQDTTTLAATSYLDSDISDSAEAVTSISEFSDIFLPIISTIGMFVGMFLYRRKKDKEKNGGLGDNDTDSWEVDHNGDDPSDKYNGDTNV